MDLVVTSEQQAIVDAAAAVLADRTDPSERWAAAAEQGWFGLGLAEDRGGVGYGLVEEALVFREIGRAVAPGPFLATALAARIDPALADGGAPVSLLVTDTAPTLGPGSVDGVGRILDGADTELVLVTDHTGAALVPASALPVVAEPCLDESCAWTSEAAFSAAPVTHVAAAEDPIHLRGLVLSAAVLTGIAEAARDLSLEHALEREQFGRPIGAHQAVKHPIADMAVRCEWAWSAVLVAALIVDDSGADASLQALSARLVAAEAAEKATRAGLQIHGGMGFTDEHPIGRLRKRGRVVSATFGGRSAQLDTVLTAPAGTGER